LTSLDARIDSGVGDGFAPSGIIFGRKTRLSGKPTTSTSIVGFKDNIKACSTNTSSISQYPDAAFHSNHCGTENMSIKMPELAHWGTTK
jgi:hypothetical protein